MSWFRWLRYLRQLDPSERYSVYEFNALATFNSERARGIVHTSEWAARMAEEQERFNRQQRERYPDAIWVEAKSGF